MLLKSNTENTKIGEPTATKWEKIKKDMNVAQRRAHMACSHAHRFVTSNSTSFLSLTCPCKNQAGWLFLCPYRNVEFFGIFFFGNNGIEIQKNTETH